MSCFMARFWIYHLFLEKGIYRTVYQISEFHRIVYIAQFSLQEKIRRIFNKVNELYIYTFVLSFIELSLEY